MIDGCFHLPDHAKDNQNQIQDYKGLSVLYHREKEELEEKLIQLVNAEKLKKQKYFFFNLVSGFWASKFWVRLGPKIKPKSVEEFFR